MNIIVNSCSECPFFVQTALSILAAFRAKPGEEKMYGQCDCPTSSGLRHHAMGAPNTPEVAANRERQEKRLKIFDGETLPEKCPLKVGDVLVTLGS